MVSDHCGIIDMKRKASAATQAQQGVMALDGTSHLSLITAARSLSDIDECYAVCCFDCAVCALLWTHRYWIMRTEAVEGRHKIISIFQVSAVCQLLLLCDASVQLQ